MFKLVLQVLLLVLLASPALAQDWVVTKVRGTVELQAAGRWVALLRGASVEDRQSVRTGPDGRAELARGAETIGLDPGTEIRLQEGAGKLTSLIQSSGLVMVDVERRNVQHFSVQTPFLAAVVKGTRFQVSVGRNAARVQVERGIVQVQDTANDLVVDVKHGQQAEVSQSDPLTVSGPGSIAVFTFEGSRIVNGTMDTVADERGRPVDSGANAAAPSGSGIGLPNAIDGNDRAGGHTSGNANDNDNDNDGNGNAGGNAGGNGNGNAGGNGKAGGNANGNNGNGNAGSNAGGNKGNGNAGGNATGNNGNGNAGGNAGGNNGNGNAGGNAGGNNGNGNASGDNGNGNADGRRNDDDDDDQDKGKGNR